MHQHIETLFDEAENRYLKPEELNLLSKYVESIPQRMETYRQLRDQELELMQQVADQLQAALPQEKTEVLERSIKNALLMLRYCAMAMLLNDDSFVETRLLSWLGRSVQAYDTQKIDATLYRLLNQRLTQVFSSQQMSLLSPPLILAQKALINQIGATK